MYGSVAVFAVVAGIASAIHVPVGAPKGNAVRHPELNELVPTCKTFTITWDADTPNPISIQLLRGPAENIQPLGAPIAEGIANTGKFEWKVPADLEADVTHYGLQLIDDVNGQFQWSNQFGISKGEGCEVASSSSAAATAATSIASKSSSMASHGASDLPGYGASATKTSVVTSSKATATGVVVTLSGSAAPTTLASSSVPSASGNGTGILPTGNATATGSTPPFSTGAAGQIQAGLGLAAAIAGLVMML